MGVNRRELMKVGFSALAGIGLGHLGVSAAQAASVAPALKPRAKRVLLVFTSGGLGQLDSFDMKPEGPKEIRGEFQPISTSIPGIQVCEHLPRFAKQIDQWALVRTMSHREFNHLPGSHQVMTGALAPNTTGSDLDRVASRQDFPCYAAALEYLHPRRDGIPSGVMLPTHLVEGPLTWPGQHAGCLGAQYDPWQIKQDPNSPHFREESLSLPSGFTLDRVTARRSLLTEINEQRDRVNRLADRGQFTDKQQLALDMLTSGKVARAFEIEREGDEIRNRYGRHSYGQSLLLARRLFQAGVPIVQANMGIVQTWDTHVNNFPNLKDNLLPPLDQGLTALIDDLRATGMLDETLVILTGEFGRTPRISTLPGATIPGRDHWPPVFTACFAGAGVQGGQVIGRSDDMAAYAVTPTFSLEDLGATVYSALGISPETEIRDQLGRPLPLNRGKPIAPLFTGAEI